MRRPPIVYLDACAVQRPMDRHVSIRELAESDCVLWLLERCRERRLALLEWSDILQLECVVRAPPERATWAAIVRSIAAKATATTDPVAQRARALEQALSISAADALHVASAEAAGAAFFVTVDDRLLRRCLRGAEHLGARPADPITAMAWFLGHPLRA